MKKYLKFQLWDFILISTSSQRNNVTRVCRSAYYSQGSRLCEERPSFLNMTRARNTHMRESAMISDCLEEGIRQFRNVIRENNVFIRRGKWRASRLTCTKYWCNETANRSRRVPLFCFCCDNKVREITAGPVKCIFPRWRTIFTNALQFSPRRHPRGLNLRWARERSCQSRYLRVSIARDIYLNI